MPKVEPQKDAEEEHSLMRRKSFIVISYLIARSLMLSRKRLTVVQKIIKMYKTVSDASWHFDFSVKN